MLKTRTHRRNVLKGLGSAGLAGAMPASVASLVTVGARAQDMAEVDLQLGWLASNGVIGEVVGIAKGFYAEEGVELSITPGGPNVDGVAAVGSGAKEGGQTSSSPALMLARSAGIPIKAIAAGYQKHPFTYFSLEGNPIREPADMVGQTIATQPTAEILLRALLAANGISEDDVEVIPMGSDMNQLVTGQVAAVTGWQTNVGALSVLGEDRVDMMLWDAGIQLYANVYFSTDDMLEEHGDVLAGFIRGSARGWQYARDNQEEAVDLLVAMFPNLDRDSELQAVGPVIGFSFGDATDAGGWGVMDPANWRAQIDTYAALEQFSGDVPTVDDVMTTAILDATAEARKG